MKYDEEYNKLSTNVETFKPKPGKYQVMILDEPIDTFYEDSEGNKTPQIKLSVNVDGKDLVWFVGKGSTLGSLYGQLITVGKAGNGLKGKTVELLVTPGKEHNTYTIPSALDLISKESK